MNLYEISTSVSSGLPFRRDAFPEKIYYYYDKDDKWFIQVNTETGCEIITYTLDLNLEDLVATDWSVDDWEDEKVDSDESNDSGEDNT